MSKSSVRWCFNLSKWSPTYQDLLLATTCIQPEEKLRLGKFVFNKDFKSSLIGRLMMRKFVSEACCIDYGELKFSRNEKGRPMVDNFDKFNISFNVSHQGDYTVLAGELHNMHLGIDIVKLEYTGGKPLHEFFRIMTQNFSTHEWKQIYSSTDEKEQLSTFYRLWSLKESYVKAIGVGITVRLDEISFKLSSPLSKACYVNDTKLFLRGQELTDWYFREILLDAQHCVAMATNKNVPEVMFMELNFGTLMENSKAFLEEDESYCLDYFKKPDKSF